ncbi:MAG: hypothetical protein HZA90_00625 [Verrucomicrobia bacterium]|nr:hypothetical protein [Verrucomicrobiota bacterium]
MTSAVYGQYGRSVLAGARTDSISDGNGQAAFISLSAWIEQVGVTACTAWRWRRKGWLKTVNICGRQYLTRQAIEDFLARAEMGEFAQVHKVPARKEKEQ